MMSFRGQFMYFFQNSGARFEFSGHFSIGMYPFRKKYAKERTCFIILHFHIYMDNIGKIQRFPEVDQE